MSKKANTRNTKGKIISAAWRLFYKQGYDDTTIEDIVFESETSRGSFYHYFDGKDDLLGSLSYVFDEKYADIVPKIDESLDSFEQLMYLNRELFDVIENSISIDLLARLYSSQLVTSGNRNLLDHNRTYYKVIKRIITDGQAKGDLTNEVTSGEIVKAYALCERALIYDWCLCKGEYSLKDYSAKMLPSMLSFYRKKH